MAVLRTYEGGWEDRLGDNLERFKRHVPEWLMVFMEVACNHRLTLCCAKENHSIPVSFTAYWDPVAADKSKVSVELDFKSYLGGHSTCIVVVRGHGEGLAEICADGYLEIGGEVNDQGGIGNLIFLARQVLGT